MSNHKRSPRILHETTVPGLEIDEIHSEARRQRFFATRSKASRQLPPWTTLSTACASRFSSYAQKHKKNQAAAALLYGKAPFG